MPVPQFPCVAIVPSGAVYDTGFEEALQELSRRGYPIHRGELDDPPPASRDQMAATALAAGFAELLWLDSAIVFDPADVERLRSLNVPISCGVYPWPGRQGVVCAFPPDTVAVRFGQSGGPTPVLWSGLGFALVRREVFEAVAVATPAGSPAAYFGTDDPEATAAAEDVAFCERARARGFEIIVDTSIRLWVLGPARLGWEDAGTERDRHPDFILPVTQAARPATPADAETQSPPQPLLQQPFCNPLRPPASPLPGTFPRLGMYVVTYPANAVSLKATLESVSASDWGTEPEVVSQPEDWPVGRDSGSGTYRRALDAALADGCDYAVLLEDDVRVNRHIRHNILTNPLVARQQCDYLGLFLPDTVSDPWERAEPHLGYRLAKPRYAGPNFLWTRTRIWGSQGLVLSRWLIKAALDLWDRHREGQDSRMMGVCSEFRVPLWYALPCLVDHAPYVSAFNTPDAYAPDFDPDSRLVPGAGFQPPDGVPGWLTIPEAEQLWRTATGLNVLELGTGCGRSTVCLGQSARRVVSVDIDDQAEAAEWVRRFGVGDRVELIRGDVAGVCPGLPGPFGLAFIDTNHDEASLTRDIDASLRVLSPGGILAFRGYPDPACPDSRRIVDACAQRRGWRRVAQAGFLGVFRT